MTEPPCVPAARPTSGQVCTILALDIDGFTRPDRDEAIRIHLHEAFYDILTKAFEGSGLPWNLCHHEDRGDGALVILPPDVPAAPVIDPFPERLRGLIRQHNRMMCDAAQIQLRAAAHIGPVYWDAYGVIGDDLNMLFRILDAAPLRRALAGSGAELAFAISSYMHDSLVLRHRTLIDPAVFSPLKTRVKRTPVNAWMYLPGAGQPPSADGITGQLADGSPTRGASGPDGTRGIRTRIHRAAAKPATLPGHAPSGPSAPLGRRQPGTESPGPHST